MSAIISYIRRDRWRSWQPSSNKFIRHTCEWAIYIIWFGSHGVVCLWLAFNNWTGCGCQLWRDTWIYDWQTTPTTWRPKGAVLWPPMQSMKDISKPLETKGPSICIYACLFLFPHLLPGLVFQLWRFELSQLEVDNLLEVHKYNYKEGGWKCMSKH